MAAKTPTKKGSTSTSKKGGNSSDMPMKKSGKKC